ncbi:MAG: endolytic transglycosylase MltG [Idiomarina sp.]|nr:endolytic transglycosylase MltG [Idiomarina sp.]
MIRNLLVALITLGFAAGVGGWLWLQHWYTDANNVVVEQAQLIEIPRGSHARSVTRQLVAKGVFESETIAYATARLFKDADRIQAGVYELREYDTPQSIWQRFNQGHQHYFSITFAEGLNFAEWRALIAEHPWLRADWQEKSAEEVMQALAPDSEFSHPEGLLFPDTYRFHAYTTDAQIFRQAYRKMESLLETLWAGRDRDVPLQSPYEALILASIVEKETGAAHERGLVASVFVNRLRTGMRLQSDPTIIYGLGDRYRGVIYRSDIQEHTAYNTYRINGLPPTPIAMPGRDAIFATLNPESSEYYYFVSRNDGTHVFSRTLQEHNRAVNQYQRNR